MRQLEKDLKRVTEERDILKSFGHLLKDTTMKFSFLENHHSLFSVESLSHVFQVKVERV